MSTRTPADARCMWVDADKPTFNKSHDAVSGYYCNNLTLANSPIFLDENILRVRKLACKYFEAYKKRECERRRRYNSQPSAVKKKEWQKFDVLRNYNRCEVCGKFFARVNLFWGFSLCTTCYFNPAVIEFIMWQKFDLDKQKEVERVEKEGRDILEGFLATDAKDDEEKSAALPPDVTSHPPPPLPDACAPPSPHHTQSTHRELNESQQCHAQPLSDVGQKRLYPTRKRTRCQQDGQIGGEELERYFQKRNRRWKDWGFQIGCGVSDAKEKKKHNDEVNPNEVRAKTTAPAVEIVDLVETSYSFHQKTSYQHNEAELSEEALQKILQPQKKTEGKSIVPSHLQKSIVHNEKEKMMSVFQNGIQDLSRKYDPLPLHLPNKTTVLVDQGPLNDFEMISIDSTETTCSVYHEMAHCESQSTPHSDIAVTESCSPPFSSPEDEIFKYDEDVDKGLQSFVDISLLETQEKSTFFATDEDFFADDGAGEPFFSQLQELSFFPTFGDE